MSDYIHKEEMSKWLKQYGQDVLHGKYKFSLMYIWKNLMDLPPIDVVPVVRCKDCKYLGITTLGSYWCRNVNGCAKPTSDSFCSYGERKE